MSDNFQRLHLDGLLISVAPHVNAALLAILHTPILALVEGDEEHRKSCVSLLKCIPCALNRLVTSVKATGVGNAAPFVAQWINTSLHMSESRQRDAFEVLFIFVSKLRLAFLERNPEWAHKDYLESSIGICFQGRIVMTINCDLCGVTVEHSMFMSVEVSSDVSEIVLNEYFVDQIPQVCSLCKRFKVTREMCQVEMPPYLIVHNIRPCSALFNLPLQMSVHSTKLEFICCIAQNGGSVMFVSLCPDGRVRMFENEKISHIAIGRLASSSDLFKDCVLTVIYKTDKTFLPQKTQAHAPKVQRKLQLKVIDFPNLACDLYNALPEQPKTRAIGTQTERAVLVDTCSQTERSTRENQPLVSYNKCKDHKKFQFFTGLSTEDFEALHDLLGGEDMIRHLKFNYNLTTPKRILKSCLTSKDKLLMFLIRLRRGLPLEELSFMFNISDSWVSDICYAMTRLTYEIFKSIEDKVFISAAEQAKNMPLVMKNFKNLRVILDGASFYIETPTNFQMQGNTYSEYKSHNVLVFIIGVSCQGSTIFCSKGFEGNISDKSALMKSPEFLEKLQKGDCIMVDRGFDVTAEMLQRGVHVIKPPPKGDSGHLNASDELLTKAVAAARIYVEHAIADIKDNRLLQGTIPLTLYPVVPQLVFIAAFLRNFSTKKIKSKKVQID